MSRIATLIALTVLLTVAAAAGAPAASESRATLRVTSTDPVALRGTAFKARERVTLTVRLGSGERRVRRLTAGALGGFTARFSTLTALDRCEIVATATGNRGSRAALTFPQAQCRPRQSRTAELRVTDTAPVTVAGAEFLAGEPVLVRATSNGEQSARRVTATPAGRFTVTFTGVTVDRCNSDLFVRAIGAGGSEAVAKIGPQLQCAPRG